MRLLEFQSVVREYVSDKAMKPRELVLVQFRDDDGFWCNVSEGLPIKQALVKAERIAREDSCETRVVRGQKREVVREFVGT